MAELGWQSWINLAKETIRPGWRSPAEYVKENIDSLSKTWRSEEQHHLLLYMVAMSTYVTAVSDQSIRKLCRESAVRMFEWWQNNRTRRYGTSLSVEPYFREIQRIALPERGMVESSLASVAEVFDIISSSGCVSTQFATRSAERMIRVLNSPVGPIHAADACHRISDYAQENDVPIFNIEYYRALNSERLFRVLSPALFATMKLRESLERTEQNSSRQAACKQRKSPKEPSTKKGRDPKFWSVQCRPELKWATVF